MSVEGWEIFVMGSKRSRNRRDIDGKGKLI
jgi:hypothetical protein